MLPSCSLLRPSKSRYILGFWNSLNYIIKILKSAFWPNLSFLGGIELILLSFHTTRSASGTKWGSLSLLRYLVTYLHEFASLRISRSSSSFLLFSRDNICSTYFGRRDCRELTILKTVLLTWRGNFIFSSWLNVEPG